jgi:hypothetical protein
MTLLLFISYVRQSGHSIGLMSFLRSTATSRLKHARQMHACRHSTNYVVADQSSEIVTFSFRVGDADVCIIIKPAVRLHAIGKCSSNEPATCRDKLLLINAVHHKNATTIKSHFIVEFFDELKPRLDNIESSNDNAVSLNNIL